LIVFFAECIEHDTSINLRLIPELIFRNTNREIAGYAVERKTTLVSTRKYLDLALILSENENTHPEFNAREEEVDHEM